MKNILTPCLRLFLILIGSAFTVNAQNISFEKTFGGPKNDYGHALTQTADGGFIITGQTFNNGDSLGDTYLVKTSANGTEQWTRIYGGNNEDGGNCVIQTSDGGYLVACHTESYGAGECDSWTFKTDADGNLLWSRLFGEAGDDVAHQVIETDDGNYMVTGFSLSHDSYGDAFVIKYASDGTQLWGKYYGDSANKESGLNIAQMPDGGFVVSGTINQPVSQSSDIFVFKINADGDLLWSKNAGGTDEEFGYGMTVTKEGDLVLCGSSRSFGCGDLDIYAVKLNENGIRLWSRVYGGPSTDEALSIASAMDDGYVLTGYTSSFGDSLDMYLLRIDAFGNELWMKTFQDNHLLKECNGVIGCADGGFAMTGSSQVTGSGNADLLLVKTDGNGNISTGLTELPPGISGFELFPDPAEDYVRLLFDKSLVDPEIKIFDDLGSLVIFSKTQEHIDVSGLPGGIYFITVTEGDKFYSRKFLKI